MIHITCAAHAFHRVAEEIRTNFPLIDRLILNLKKVFLKANSRIEVFKETLPNAPLPPQPILTRWGTWLEAVQYVSENFGGLKSVFEKLNEDEAA